MKSITIGLIISVWAAVAVTIGLELTNNVEPVFRTAPVTKITSECPEPTKDGVYFVRGHDKVTGEAVCGFSWYNPCPYVESAPAGDPACEKAKEFFEQPASVTPETEPQAVEWLGK